MTYFKLWISNLSIRNKLIVLLLIPMLALLGFSAQLLKEADLERNKLQVFSVGNDVFQSIDVLTDNLQRERGMSAGFLSSHGEKFSSALQTQRVKTDQALSDYQQIVSTLSTNFKAYDEVSYGLKDSEQLLRQISQTRAAVDALSMSASKSSAYYTSVNTGLLNSASDLIRLGHNAKYSVSSDFALMQTSIYAFFLQKELAGQERALMTKTFVHDAFSPKDYTKFLTLIAEQASYLNTFKQTTEPSYLGLINTVMLDPQYVAVEKMRNIAIAHAEGGQFGVDANAWFSAISGKISLLKTIDVQLLSDLNKQVHVVANHVRQEEIWVASICAMIILFSITFAWMLIRSFVTSMSEAVRIANEVAAGHMDCTSNIEPSKDEVGDMLRAMDQMQHVLFAKIIKEKEEATRITTALDKAKACIMMADTNQHIMYMNESVTTMFKDNENKIREALPNFDVSKMIGSSLDSFHKNPSHQQNILQHLNATVSSSIEIADLHFSFNATPIVGDAGESLGTVVEWVDRTAEFLLNVKIKEEVGSVVNQAQAGDLTGRIDVQNQDGLVRGLSESINALLDKSEQAIGDTVQGLKHLEQGDLTYRIESQYAGSFDTIKQAFNNSSHNIHELVSEVMMGNTDVLSGSSEISRGNETLSERTQQQAAALEEISATLEEISSTVLQNSDNAQIGNTLAKQAKEQAENGAKVANDTMKAMDEISGNSHKISDIIGVIDEIAFQTNLLALNAAVEAARAGEQGRGFAVVAGEVRTLAQRSAGAAKEIKDLIHHSSQTVEKGKELAYQSSAALEEIVVSSEKVNDIIAEISQASQEQSTATQEISKAIADIDGNTQQNAALVEETAAASQGLDEKARHVENMISKFHVVNTHSEQLAQNFSKEPQRSQQAQATQELMRINAQAATTVAKKSRASSKHQVENDVWNEF